MRRHFNFGGRDRWLAIALLIGAMGLIYLLCVHSWWGAPMLELQHQTRELRIEGQRLRMRASQRPQIQARIAELNKLEQDNPAFLPEATSELAMAGLMQRLEKVAKGSGEAQSGSNDEPCTIVNRTTTPHDDGGERFTRVGIRVRVRCSTEALAGMLHALESERPQLFIDKLTLQGRGDSSAPGPLQAGTLDANFDIYGYLRAEVENRAKAKRG